MSLSDDIYDFCEDFQKLFYEPYDSPYVVIKSSKEKNASSDRNVSSIHLTSTDLHGIYGQNILREQII